jgi:hypothetical protein
VLRGNYGFSSPVRGLRSAATMLLASAVPALLAVAIFVSTFRIRAGRSGEHRRLT